MAEVSNFGGTNIIDGVGNANHAKCKILIFGPLNQSCEPSLSTSSTILKQHINFINNQDHPLLLDLLLKYGQVGAFVYLKFLRHSLEHMLHYSIAIHGCVRCHVDMAVTRLDEASILGPF